MKAILARYSGGTHTAILLSHNNTTLHTGSCTAGNLAAAKNLVKKHYGEEASNSVEPCKDPTSHAYQEAEAYQNKVITTWEFFQFDPIARAK